MTNPIKGDPTRTGRIQKRAVKDMMSRMMAVRRKVVEQIRDRNALGIGLGINHTGELLSNTEWAFLSDARKVQAFRSWIDLLFQRSVLEPYGGQVVDAPWMAEYINNTYRQSVNQAYLEARGAGLGSLGQGAGARAASQETFVAQAFNAPLARNQLQMLYQRSFDLLKGISQDASKEMSQVLAQGLVDGSHERIIAKNLANRLDLKLPRAEAIVRTEIVYTHAEAMLDTYDTLGVEGVNVLAEWNTAGDDRVCGRCAALEGIIMTIQEARGLIPRHPRCVTGDMVVDAPGTRSMMRSLYTGDIYDFTDSLGKRVSVTSNHILLTQRGWVFAKDIRQTDYLIDASGLYSGSGREHNDLDEPTVENVFSSLLKLSDKGRISETLAMPEHLHGDGKSVKGKIQIINTEGVLWDEVESFIRGNRIERPLQMRDLTTRHTLLHESSRFLDLSLKRLGDASDSLMSSLGVRDVLRERSPLHHESVGLGLPSQLNTIRLQQPCHCGSACSKFGCELVDRSTPLVPLDDCLTREVSDTPTCGRAVQTRLLEGFGDVLLGSSGSLGYGSDGQPFFTELREIDNIRIRHVVDLPVYDLNTESTLYNCNGFVSSNCRCSLLPANIGETPFRGQVVQRRNKADIRRRIEKSLLAERKSKISLEEAISIAKWPGARLLE